MKASKNREKRSVVGENALKQNLPSLSHGYGAGRCCQQLCLQETVMYAKMSLLSGGRGHGPPKQRHEGLRAQSEGRRGLEGAAGTWAVQKRKRGIVRKVLQKSALFLRCHAMLRCCAAGAEQCLAPLAFSFALVALLCFAKRAYMRAAHVLRNDTGFIIAGRTPVRAVRLRALKGAEPCI